MGRALVWFRSDLRVADNPALLRAASDREEVAAVFCICRKQWKEHGWGDAKIDFVLGHVAHLCAELGELGIPLRIVSAPTFQGVPSALLKLARSVECDALYFNREYEWNEQQRDGEVSRLFEQKEYEVWIDEDQTLIPPEDIQTGKGGFYTVFTPYKRVVLDSQIPEPGGRPRKQKKPCPSDPLPEFTRHPTWPIADGPKRLKAFCRRHLRDYPNERDFPALDTTSRLSPYLAIGAISTRQCLAEALKIVRKDHPWISELIWRDFYRHVLVGFPHVSKGQPFRPISVRWKNNKRHFEAWCNGQTGVPIIDAAMNQLHQENWMHNRLRMIVAMYLTKDLLIDWRWGEGYFAKQLIDIDLASNNGGWQWSASTGTDAAPYFRIFNPYTQSAKFDPDATFIRHYLPKLEAVDSKIIHDPTRWPDGLHEHLDYPTPVVDHALARKAALEAYG